MGLRLTRITTRTGDDGSTGLGDGRRTGKDHARIAVLGELDELNAQLGLLRTENLPAAITEHILTVQHDLFDLGGELCLPGYEKLTEQHVTQLEAWVTTQNATLPALQEFILPGGARSAAHAHVARTVCRRAERSLVHLSRTEEVRPLCLQYLNRLSDWLFVLARTLNQVAGCTDTLWNPRRTPTQPHDSCSSHTPAKEA